MLSKLIIMLQIDKYKNFIKNVNCFKGAYSNVNSKLSALPF